MTERCRRHVEAITRPGMRRAFHAANQIELRHQCKNAGRRLQHRRQRGSSRFCRVQDRTNQARFPAGTCTPSTPVTAMRGTSTCLDGASVSPALRLVDAFRKGNRSDAYFRRHRKSHEIDDELLSLANVGTRVFRFARHLAADADRDHCQIVGKYVEERERRRVDRAARIARRDRGDSGAATR